MSPFNGKIGDRAFDVAVAPTVTNGAYSAGDIMGGLMTFNAGHIAETPVLITGVQVVCKAAVTPNLRLMLFNADPSATTKTDNSAYSLVAADAFKLIAAIDLSGETWSDHGTPNSIEKRNLAIVADVAADTNDLYGLLIDDTGVTLTSTSDIQVRLSGLGA